MDKRLLQRIDVLPGWLSIHEGLFLYKAARIVKNIKGVVVEIGSFQGKSTIYLAKTNQRIYAIDPHKGLLDNNTATNPTFIEFKKNIKSFSIDNKVSLIKKTSSSAVHTWNKQIKLLFIDGLHDEKNALFDYKNWSPFLMNGGIIAMHDAFCGWKGAQKVALENIIFSKDYYEVGVVGSIVYGIKGKGNLLTVLNRIRIQLVIQIAYVINAHTKIPKTISFFLIHRVCKLFLLNRFTLQRNENYQSTDINSVGIS